MRLENEINSALDCDKMALNCNDKVKISLG